MMTSSNAFNPLDIKDNIYLNEFARQRSLESAYRLLLKLRELNLNVVTAESLTAGLIAKTLVDIPTFGSNVYGGIIVYDSDAKRKYLNVKTMDVYSAQAAAEMAEGALLNSRAMVSIAVTGHAGPVASDDVNVLGIVDIGVSVRFPSVSGIKEQWSFCTQTRRIENCNGNANFKKICDQYKKELKTDFGECLPINTDTPFMCSTVGTLSLVRNIIRTNTVALACNFALEVLTTLQAQNKFPIPDVLEVEKWDGSYINCYEPSPIIERYLNKESMAERIANIAKEIGSQLKAKIIPAKTFTEFARNNPNIFPCTKEDKSNPQCVTSLKGGGIYKSKYLKYKTKYLSLKNNDLTNQQNI